MCLNPLAVVTIEVTFHDGEYFSFSLKDNPIPVYKNVISLRFKTIHRSGLLLYGRGAMDFFQLELVNGVLR